MNPLALVLALAASAQAYWLMGTENFITTERLDPVVSPGKISGHVHSVVGGSNFRSNTNTELLRQSECTSIPIPEDKSAYWFPHLYFEWANGSFTSVNGGTVIADYLFGEKPGTTTAFPDDFRMISGDPTLRTYDPSSYAQQAVTFLCLDFNGVTTKHNSIPAKSCPSGVRAQINFPSCWDGKNTDSPDHKSHVAFLSGGPDSGTCSDPKFPVTLPRIFIEVYWATNDFEQHRGQAGNSSQPFVYSYGDRTGYGYHADYINGWDKGVLQKAVDNCHCNIYGDPQCCADQGIFHLNKDKHCRITRSINEATTGTLPKLPGNNPVQPEGKRATSFADTSNPQLISPVYVYTGDNPTQTGTVVPGGTPPGPTSVAPTAPSPTVSSVVTSSVSPTSVVAPSQTPSTSSPVAPPPPPPSQVYTPPTVSNPPHTVPHATTTTKIVIPSISIPSVSIPSIHIPSISTPSIPKATGGSSNGGGNNGSNSGHGVAPNYPVGTAPAQHLPAPTPGHCRPRNSKSKYRRSTRRSVSDNEDVEEVSTQNAGGGNDPERRPRLQHRRFMKNHARGVGAFHLW